MSRKPKEPKQADRVGVCLWRWDAESGRYFETEAVAYPGGADGELETLTCECGQESDASEWPAFEPETVCSCPGCGAFFRLTVPKGEGPAELAAPKEEPPTTAGEIPDLEVAPVAVSAQPAELPTSSEPEAELTESVAQQIQTLTEEWMDLAFLLEQMADEKKVFLDGWKERAGKASQRVREIRGEITAIKSGATAPPGPAAVAARQVEMFQALDN